MMGARNPYLRSKAHIDTAQCDVNMTLDPSKLHELKR